MQAKKDCHTLQQLLDLQARLVLIFNNRIIQTPEVNHDMDICPLGENFSDGGRIEPEPFGRILPARR
ncbi:hypothetical protein [Desulfonatronospira thiodismutans]|uniref:hypothetical protein n=1 Tax=Desulfonatronospira thiodismutans TaxID=488939 RepID=UPI00137582F0|nr:hypothetical protein [Desulfonatronospira thiodismutans]